MPDIRPEDIVAVIEQIRPILRGKPAEMQGAVLADLLAIWLAGHHVEGDPDATRKFRAELLSAHLLQVRKLVTINAHMIGTTP